MLELHDMARRLLETNRVKLIIGYSEGRADKPRPVFIATAADVAQLIFDERCIQNLAVYALKPEVKIYGTIGIVADAPVIRSVLQLAAENQIREGEVILLHVSADGRVSELSRFPEMEASLAQGKHPDPSTDREKISLLRGQSREDRWHYWLNEFSRCIRCYACRAACPMCYCPSCTADCNQPQWISVPSNTPGNLEWQIMRAMHLAGRCTGCGECARACPVDIPIHLLTLDLNETIADTFQQQAGMKAKPDYVLATFKTDDKENFIR
jgi:ferredoxin